MGFSRQEWSGLPFPPSGNFPGPGILRLLRWQADSLPPAAFWLSSISLGTPREVRSSHRGKARSACISLHVFFPSLKDTIPFWFCLFLTVLQSFHVIGLRTSLVVRWLRRHASSAGCMGSIPDQGTRILRVWPKKEVIHLKILFRAYHCGAGLKSLHF